MSLDEHMLNYCLKNNLFRYKEVYSILVSRLLSWIKTFSKLQTILLWIYIFEENTFNAMFIRHIKILKPIVIDIIKEDTLSYLP